MATAIIQSTLSGPSVTVRANSDGGPVRSVATVLNGPSSTGIAAFSSTRTLFGQPIIIYRVPFIIQVTYAASTAFGGYFMKNYPLNRTDFRMVRGVQNEINFYVRDVDRKPVALGSTETLTINIVDPVTETLLMTRNLATIDSGQGIYMLTVLPSEMDTWPTGPVRWSIVYNRADSTTVMLWTDRVYAPYSTLTVTDGPVPGPYPTTTIMWSDLMKLNDNNYYSSSLKGAASYGFNNGMQTFNITMANFTGTIRIDGSLQGQPLDDPSSPDWFQVDLQVYADFTGSVQLNEQGNYLWMRMVVIPDVSNTGTVSETQYKS